MSRIEHSSFVIRAVKAYAKARPDSENRVTVVAIRASCLSRSQVVQTCSLLYYTIYYTSRVDYVLLLTFVD